jgi:hypothetical protein
LIERKDAAIVLQFHYHSNTSKKLSTMKYLLLLSALLTAFNGDCAAESRALQEAEGENKGLLGGAIRQFLADTLDTVQTFSNATLSDGAVLSTVECSEITRENNPCVLAGGVEGMSMCRNLGGLDVTICAPKVFDVWIGASDDRCGCCPDQPCPATIATECLCTCQDGKGILVKHEFFSILSRPVTWNACYTPTIANALMNARSEFTCYDSCPEAQAAAANATAANATAANATAAADASASASTARSATP